MTIGLMAAALLVLHELRYAAAALLGATPPGLDGAHHYLSVAELASGIVAVLCSTAALLVRSAPRSGARGLSVLEATALLLAAHFAQEAIEALVAGNSLSAVFLGGEALAVPPAAFLLGLFVVLVCGGHSEVVDEIERIVERVREALCTRALAPALGVLAASDRQDNVRPLSPLALNRGLRAPPRSLARS
ncbi:hypothetical protein JDY09_00735 [Thermoleophilum album]|jgi:hypothetical protein|uniref:hypothetical protein n=1 Tax=Thermoleophilum album TaxID=29539 RepID=UPI00237C79E1|nr:hypothetical protein [Thermoleophilum album]WDT93821.1 hypothetical protein JDY09_00735 [Thermoleophilum album]